MVASAVVSAAVPAAATESIRGRGLVAGAALYLFADVHTCGEEQSLPAAQIYVSTDDGKTWGKRGPSLTGSEFQYAQVDGGALWAAGLHTAEGPAIDPFVLVPTAGAVPFAWTVRTIREGPAELMEVARAGPPDLYAWVRPTDAQGDRPRKASLLYASHDRGLSWSAAKNVPAKHRSALQKLSRITTRSGPWRIVDRQDGGFDLQRLEAAGWKVVRQFPWAACPPG